MDAPHSDFEGGLISKVLEELKEANDGINGNREQ